MYTLHVNFLIACLLFILFFSFPSIYVSIYHLSIYNLSSIIYLSIYVNHQHSYVVGRLFHYESKVKFRNIQQTELVGICLWFYSRGKEDPL